MNTRRAVLGFILLASPALVLAQAIDELRSSVPDHDRWEEPAARRAPEGLNEAAEVCGGLSFGSNKAQCMTIVNSARYFSVPAVRVCGSASFDNEKMGCLRAAVDKDFQPEAVSVCSSMSFGANRAACLNATAGKMYLPAEIRACASSSFDNEKIGCLNAGGRPLEMEPAPRPYPRHRECREFDGYVVRELREIQSAVQRGNFPRAVARLATLIERVEDAMRDEPRRRP